MKRLTFRDMACIGGLWNTGVAGCIELAKGIITEGMRSAWTKVGSEFGFIYQQLPTSIETFMQMPSEEYVKALARAHLKWVEVIFSVGWGSNAELSHQLKLRPFIELCHRYNLKVSGYFSFTNIFHERVFKDIPGSEDWIQRKSDGSYALYFSNPDRYLACLNARGYINHQKKLIRRAAEFGVDGIFFDNVWYRCYCDTCKQKFKEYISERFGSPHEMPLKFNARNPVNRILIEFRVKVIADTFKELADFAKELRPSMVLTYNAHANVYHIRLQETVFTKPLNRDVDYVFSEDSEFKGRPLDKYPGMRGGEVKFNIPIYKNGSAEGDGRLLHYHPTHHFALPPNVLRLTIAEAAANLGSLTLLIPGDEEGREVTLRTLGEYYGFMEENIDLYSDLKPLSEIALYWSNPSLYWYVERGKSQYTHFRGMVKYLIEEHVPFDILIDEQLTAKRLGRYKVLILPNSVCLSDGKIDVIKGFVKSGGSLFASQETSFYTETYEKRSRFPLSDLYDLGPGKSLRRYGEGRVAYLPKMDEEYWLMGTPSSRKNLEDALNWVHPNPKLRINAPATVQIMPYLKDGRLILHCVNYNCTEERYKIVEAENVKIHVSKARIRGVRTLSPDGSVNDATISEDEEGICITIPTLHIYSVVDASL